jgi:hypothetical protein
MNGPQPIRISEEDRLRMLNGSCASRTFISRVYSSVPIPILRHLTATR